MPDRISQLLSPQAVSLDLQGRKKPELIAALVQLLADSGVVQDANAVTQHVLEREKLATTGVGDGIAIPHCLSDQVSGTAMAFGRKVPGIRFDAVDRQPVQLFFLMVGLPDAHNEHLRLLSKLSRYLHDNDTRASLLAASSPEAVVDVFARRERR